ncbi:MAG: glutamine-hydrolyzing carbamoyl-phosphate synthase small subunit, partial [Candidatus Levybacteria bacterium]|nr:glutamine-hydrolyzing carbamoyl-phosphate synthase small subunit [Candidatus Levybacteria bacterium]
MVTGKLVLFDGTTFSGSSFGKEISTSGEVVFTTGMVGYVEALTDPSYAGQILVFTYPLIGNYGVPDSKYFESEKIHARAVIVCNYTDTPSHHASKLSFGEWLEKEGVAGLEISDTRFITQKLRTSGSMLGKIEIGVNGRNIKLFDPNKVNLVSQVSTKDVTVRGSGKKKIVLIDCGSKRNIERSLLKRGVQVTTVPWDYDIFDKNISCDGILISNGPGDPKMATKTIEIIKKALSKKIPTFGICLGNQLLALAAGGDTFKLKYGHRSQNQPCILEGGKRCYITTQNHGYAVGKIPPGYKEWFTNA